MENLVNDIHELYLKYKNFIYTRTMQNQFDFDISKLKEKISVQLKKTEVDSVNYDICVIGCGRVGFPLVLAFAAANKSIIACDINPVIRNAFKHQEMPFDETGCSELLKRLPLISTCTPDNLPDANYYIITCGTPVKQHFEADVSAVEDIVMNLISQDKLHENTTLILRSTLAPGTTDFIKKILERENINCNIAMCPERLVEGGALEEIHKLPQIIGVYNDKSWNAASSLFSVFRVKLLRVLPIEAELCKLMNNTYRYINFAIPNYFMYLLDFFGVENPLKVMNIAKEDYPRMKGLAGPGFTAGTCVPGNRTLKLQDSNNTEHEKTLEDFYKEFIESTNEFFTQSYNSTITQKNKKKILKVTKNAFTGKMFKFTLENNKTFECTEYHLIPVKRNGKIQILKAFEIISTDEFFLQ